MDRDSWSDYEKYLVMADNSSKLAQTYTGFVNFKDLVSILKKISVSAENQFQFNGRLYDTPFTSERAKQALSNIDNGTFDRAITQIAALTKLNIY